MSVSKEISTLKCIPKYTEPAPTKKGYLLKRTEKGCVFFIWDKDGKACQEWTPSLSKPECLLDFFISKLYSRYKRRY